MDFKNTQKVSIILFLCLIFYFTLFAQENKGIIQGRFIDEEGIGMSDLEVTLSGPNIVTKNTNTNSSGEYRFLFLPIGEYSITAMHRGFFTVNIGNITIKSDEPVRVTAKIGSDGKIIEYIVEPISEIQKPESGEQKPQSDGIGLIEVTKAIGALMGAVAAGFGIYFGFKKLKLANKQSRTGNSDSGD